MMTDRLIDTAVVEIERRIAAAHAAGRAEALEEAAKIVEAGCDEPSDDPETAHVRSLMKRLATRLRAIADAPTAKEST